MAGKSLKNTKSLDNLREAFARESQANRRYLYFARVADIEGFPAPARAVALFATCQVEYDHPAVARAAVRVLEKNGVAVTLPTQRCCGIPYPDGGAADKARALVRDNVRSLAESARQGCDIPIQGSDGRTQNLTTSAGALSPTTRTASPPARAARSRCVSDTCSSCRPRNRIVFQGSHGLHSRTSSINAAKNGGKHGRN